MKQGGQEITKRLRRTYMGAAFGLLAYLALSMGCNLWLDARMEQASQANRQLNAMGLLALEANALAAEVNATGNKETLGILADSLVVAALQLRQYGNRHEAMVRAFPFEDEYPLAMLMRDVELRCLAAAHLIRQGQQDTSVAKQQLEQSLIGIAELVKGKEVHATLWGMVLVNTLRHVLQWGVGMALLLSLIVVFSVMRRLFAGLDHTMTQHQLTQADLETKNQALATAQHHLQELNKDLENNAQSLLDNLALATQLRHKLELRERELHDTQVRVQVGRVVLDMVGRRVTISVEAAAVLGMADGTLSLGDFLSLFTSESAALFHDIAHYGTHGLGTFSCWLERETATGKTYLKAEAQPTATTLNLTLQDQTQERRANLEAVAAKQRAEEATQAKANFLSTISHEIRNPLNAIIGLAELLNQESPRPDQRENLDAMVFAARNMLALLNDVLDFSKIEAGKIAFSRSPIHLPSLLQGLSQVFGMQASQKGLQFTVIADRLLPTQVLGDELRLSQILTNLVSNAVKFTRHGSVRVEAHYLPGEVLELVVSDTGIGIAETALPMLFQAFQQANPAIVQEYGGTGLGLSIVKPLVELQGGSIQVQSVLGQGTTFTVQLPAPAMPLEVIQPTARTTTFTHAEQILISQPLKGLAVLVVEDNRVNRMVVTKLLSKWGATYREAANGQEALEVLIHFRPHVLLLDLEMPVMDGYALSQRLQQNLEWSQVSIIALSANADRPSGVVCHHYLTKPLEPEHLLETLLHCLPTMALSSGLN